jgi:hypothetical protein
MGVYNAGAKLPPTLDSVLSQQGVDFEFIVIDDGSTDGTGTMLQAYGERDRRIRLVSQPNAGLTRALIRGCELARGEFIARQDAGDVSLDGRLEKQLGVMERNPKCVLVSCGTRVVDEDGDLLHESWQDDRMAAAGLRARTIAELRGPSHHGATMFRADAYRRVGGYRPQFLMAQDIDLWLRLAEIGEPRAIPEVLYQAEFAPGSISAGRHRAQQQIGGLILESARLRREGRDDAPVLTEALAVATQALIAKPGRGAAAYAIGAALVQRKPAMARRQFLTALRENPGHLKAWIRLIGSYFVRTA